ncbi:cytochrome b/b6 domain-containing protein [Amaricoccus sp.]|uniref:cytochrome b n=1 Tax=Amaricoccus sp. TaxID=1872485 RepID=UPI001B4C6525|nr:cytochrome b/b6 domain-containing protein [Amaricoccus sp.]MBP7241183.1 cytochrome b [Amaricoccus sp.]
MGYGVVARIFHWGTVLMIVVMIPVGLIMTQEIPRSIQDPLFILHKGLGVVVLVVVVLRIAWRLANPPPPLPASIPALQRRVARATHLGLYALLLAMPVSGYVRVIAGGFPIELLNALGVPPLLGKNEPLAAAASTFHFGGALALMALILLHVAGASYHGLVRRDGVASRMWPPFST